MDSRVSTSQSEPAGSSSNSFRREDLRRLALLFVVTVSLIALPIISLNIFAHWYGRQIINDQVRRKEAMEQRFNQAYTQHPVSKPVGSNTDELSSQ